MSSEAKWIPQIVSEQGGDTRRKEKIVREAIREALKLEECANSIEPYKCHGLAGHRVIDDYLAIEALLNSCTPTQKREIESQGLNAYRLTQQLNMALRNEFEMVNGKLTGKLSPRKLALLAKRQETSQPPEAAAA